MPQPHQPDPTPSSPAPKKPPRRGERWASFEEQRRTGIIPRQPGQKERTPRRVFWRRVRAVAILLFVVVIPTLVLGIIPTVGIQYDKTHRMTIACDVESVRSSSSSTRSLRGVGSSRVQIVFETTNCGDLILSEGVWRENVDELAAELDARPGRYEFDTGESGWAMRDFYALLRVSPTVEAYERVP